MNRQYTGVNSPAPEERKAQIYLEYHDKVLSYVRGKISDSHEAEDIASSVFLKVYQKLDTYDCTRSSISTWIYTITRNTVIDYFRRHHTFCGYSDLDVENTELCSGSLDGEEVLIQLSESLLKLKEKERELIILHYYRGQCRQLKIK